MKAEVKRKHPVLIVLQSLLDGIPVEIEGEEYWLDAETRKLAIRREMVNTKTGKKREATVRVQDPFVLGRIGSRWFALDHFDATKLERYMLAEFCKRTE